ncbi:helix-turn-helix domain-containing protein [Euryhalocaulis caribicus]|uniref:helix-turn-helix domain-containing protein n=1 Tax=Euryhalocaulis caribicus TaxID=1161401 RepID=UPI00039CDBA5|nr:helix-turn-helix domain-containing protein [Euryhalocaulis caribicus]
MSGGWDLIALRDRAARAEGRLSAILLARDYLLSPQEARVFETLAGGRWVRTDRLCEAGRCSPHTLKVVISRLRGKLGEDGAEILNNRLGQYGLGESLREMLADKRAAVAEGRA